MGSGIQAIDKTNELLPVMTVCRNNFHNGAMTHSCYKFMKVLSVEFLWHGKQYFHALISNLKTATWLLVHKLSQLHKTLILGTHWLVFLRSVLPIGMGLMFSKMNPGSIYGFDITEKNSM